MSASSAPVSGSGGANSGTQVDELLRELRLTPMLQLGVTYSF